MKTALRLLKSAERVAAATPHTTRDYASVLNGFDRLAQAEENLETMIDELDAREELQRESPATPAGRQCHAALRDRESIEAELQRMKHQLQ